MTDLTSDPKPSGKPRFDDRIDTEPEITNREVLGILGRTLRVLGSFRGLFGAKIGLSLLAQACASKLEQFVSNNGDQLLSQA